MVGSPAPALSHVEHWVFDLDNTLYPSESNLFAQVDQRMTDFVAQLLQLPREDARALQKDYYARYGTTLAGLMQVHDLHPDEFLDYVHDIDLSPINSCNILRAAIASLPGEKFVFTNGSRGHAERVLKARGLEGLFDDIADIASVGYRPKPFEEAYDAAIRQFGITPMRSAFFEDLARNLAHPKQMGFTTVLVETDYDWSEEPEHVRPAARGTHAPPFVDYTTHDLTGFLHSLPRPSSTSSTTS